MIRRPLNILFVFLLVGCSGSKNQVYEGLSLDDWGIRLGSTDPAVRADALDVISTVGSEAKSIERTVRLIARHDSEDDIRLKAVTALDSMGADIREFRELLEQYFGPPEDEPEEVEFDIVLEDELSGKSSSDDDFAFLQALEDGTLDDERSSNNDMFPSDSIEVKNWVEERQVEEMQDLMTQLSDPNVLSKMILLGDELQRRYAAKLLSDIGGENSEIVTALEKASADEDSLVSMLAKEALKKWSLP